MTNLIIKNLLLLLSLCLLASGCSKSRSHKEMSKIAPASTKEIPIKQPFSQSSSLWKGNSSSFLSTNKGWKIGDIVKISVKIQGSAQLEGNQTDNRKKSISNPFTRLFGAVTNVGLGILGGASGGNVQKFTTGMDGKFESEFGDFKSTRSLSSGDKVMRKESVNFEIAVVVKEVLPSGNLVIDGTKEINVNGESRKMYVQGIIRPKDIDSDNCIDSSKVAEAKIAYGIKETKTRPKKGNN